MENKQRMRLFYLFFFIRQQFYIAFALVEMVRDDRQQKFDAFILAEYFVDFARPTSMCHFDFRFEFSVERRSIE